MPIYEESRYEQARLVPVPDDKGVYHSTIIANQRAVPTDYTVYRVRYGDRMDVLADAAYGDAEFWWRIADANPELEFPDQLTPGQLIRIPRSTIELG